jgi:hypothetical protein
MIRVLPVEPVPLAELLEMFFLADRHRALLTGRAYTDR